MEEERKEKRQEIGTVENQEEREFYTDEEFEEIYNEFWTRMTYRFIRFFVAGFLTGLVVAGIVVKA